MRKTSIPRLFAALTALLCAVTLPAQTITVSGHISDSKSGETLISAGVLSGDDSKLGAVTNNFGYYSLTLPSKDAGKDGRISLQYSYVGYEPQVVSFKASKDTVINVLLVPSSQITESIVVARRDAGLQSSYLGSIDVPITQIQQTPMLFGESDVLKVIQLLPGVQGGMEGFSGLYVRGGGPDENLILLDGVPIYNVDHMLGLFSVFQPEAVKKVTLYKGSFPARYNGRVSSILDIRTNDGNMKEHKGSVTLGVINNKLHLEGPIIKDKLSYSLSARGMHTGLYAPIIKHYLKDEYYNYYFYDLTGKLTWRISDRDRLYFGAYSGADRFVVEIDNSYKTEPIDLQPGEPARELYTDTENYDAKMQWGNNVASLRWNHIFSSRLFANTSLAYNSYSMNMSLYTKENRLYESGRSYSSSYGGDFNSGIMDISAKMDFDYNPNPSHLVKFGVAYTRHNFYPESLSTVGKEIEDKEVQLDTAVNFLDSQKYGGNDLSVYAEDDIRIGERLTVNPGLNAAWFNTKGKSYWSVQPRLSAKLSFDGLSFKAGYARMAQYVHLLSSGQISLPTDLWVPITENIRPVISDQFSLGAYYDGLKGWEFSLEGYWKEMRNILEYKDGIFVLGSMGGWEDKVTMGNGRAYGMEFFVQKTMGKLTGWLAYTLAKSDRHFPDGSINNGIRFPYKYDRRHNLNINLNWAVSKKVDINATWSYLTGGLLTHPEDRTLVLEPDGSYLPTADHITSRNNYRLPPSHRLNLGFNFKKVRRRGSERIWTIGVYNAYNRMNPNFVYLTDNYNNDNRRVMQVEKLTILPIIPSISYTVKF